MNINVTIRLPYLWDGTFQKSDWGSVNFLIGPNGTGKTLFAAELKQQCQRQGLRPRYLNAERLAGLERQHYGNFGSTNLHDGFQIPQYQTYKQQSQEFGLSGDGFILLSEKLDLKTKVEATLSQLFDRELTLSTETGTLRPKLRRGKGETYDLRQSECHGLKELITLLTFLYDDDNDCVIIDEPELHLHPQFQAFLLQHIRQIAGDPRATPGRKVFFLITHSPFLVDVRTVADLRHCLVFQPGRPPAYIESLDPDDEYKVKRLLPRLNTHHKQFFFSSAPIFVEGYTDQQLFSLIQEGRGRLIGAVGSCLIDVTGKDELALFHRFCDRLGIDGRYVADLDALFGGNLRQLASRDERCSQYLQDAGVGADGMEAIGLLERPLGECIQAVESLPDAGLPAVLTHLKESFRQSAKEDPGKSLARKRYAMTVAVLDFPDEVGAALPAIKGTVGVVRGRVLQVIEGFEQAKVYLLRKGVLENYLPSYTGNPFSVPKGEKAEVFERERTVLLEGELDEAGLQGRYGPLIRILDGVTRVGRVSVDQQLVHHLADWVHKVQSAFKRNAPADIPALEKDPVVEWKVYSRLLTLLAYDATGTGFTCRVKFKPIIDQWEREITFTDRDVPTHVTVPPRTGEARAGAVLVDRV